MKKFFLLILLGFVSQASCAEIKIELEISRIHCLYHFVESISADRPSAIKAFFEESPFFNKERSESLQEFRSILRQAKSFDEKKLVTESMSSASISELKKRTKSMIDESSQDRFFEIIESFSSIYDKLIWEKCSGKLEECKSSISNIISKKGVGDFLEKVKLFLGSEWPDEKPFKVLLYPIPIEQGTSRSRSFGDHLQYVGIQVNAKSMNRKIGTICHEICHSLMNYMSKEKKKEVYQLFMESASKCKFWTYCRLFEIIPTCAGNGWINELLTGELDKTNWYEDEFVNTLSRGIYQTFKQYLLSGKTIDKNFAEKCIQVFSDNYPNAEKNFENIFCGVFIIGNPDEFDPQKVFEIIKQKFYFAGYRSFSSPIAHKFTISGAKETAYSIVLVAHDKNLPELGIFIQEQTSLAPFENKLLKPGAKYVFTTVDGHGKAMIIIKASDYKELNGFFDQIYKAGEIHSDKEFIVYHDS